MLGIPLRELGLETEAVAVVAVEKAEVGRSDEIDTGTGSRRVASGTRARSPWRVTSRRRNPERNAAVDISVAKVGE